MCLFIGILFLVGLPISVLSGTFTGDPVLMGMLWLAGSPPWSCGSGRPRGRRGAEDGA